MPELLVTDRAVAFLNEQGFKISSRYFQKITAPSVNRGPQAAGYWGSRKVYQPEVLLNWARGRIRAGREAER
jgi:hypothetical protein